MAVELFIYLTGREETWFFVVVLCYHYVMFSVKCKGALSAVPFFWCKLLQRCGFTGGDGLFGKNICTFLWDSMFRFMLCYNKSHLRGENGYHA